jgi:hypothetical protein
MAVIRLSNCWHQDNVLDETLIQVGCSQISRLRNAELEATPFSLSDFIRIRRHVAMALV